MCIQGSILFGAGFCLVVFGWAIVGMIVETYGFVLLFRYVLAYNTLLFHTLGIIIYHAGHSQIITSLAYTSQMNFKQSDFAQITFLSIVLNDQM